MWSRATGAVRRHSLNCCSLPPRRRLSAPGAGSRCAARTTASGPSTTARLPAVAAGAACGSADRGPSPGRTGAGQGTAEAARAQADALARHASPALELLDGRVPQDEVFDAVVAAEVDLGLRVVAATLDRQHGAEAIRVVIYP